MASIGVMEGASHIYDWLTTLRPVLLEMRRQEGVTSQVCLGRFEQTVNNWFEYRGMLGKSYRIHDIHSLIGLYWPSLCSFSLSSAT